MEQGGASGAGQHCSGGRSGRVRKPALRQCGRGQRPLEHPESPRVDWSPACSCSLSLAAPSWGRRWPCWTTWSLPEGRPVLRGGSISPGGQYLAERVGVSRVAAHPSSPAPRHQVGLGTCVNVCHPQKLMPGGAAGGHRIRDAPTTAGVAQARTTGEGQRGTRVPAARAAAPMYGPGFWLSPGGWQGPAPPWVGPGPCCTQAWRVRARSAQKTPKSGALALGTTHPHHLEKHVALGVPVKGP